ncbi:MULTISPECIES: hypothetical protein [unclassified Streptomyces]|uniref:hypothetical protein n=1 Tax=unclassified Streptomyces TaxID=2593676 RepID=UPI0033A36A13
MTTDTATTTEATTTHDEAGRFRLRPAGRHRKPSRRRVVLAVGGFALAAGALSLVRLAPESVTGGGGTAEAEPRIAATDTAATVETGPATDGGHPSGTTRAETTTAVSSATAMGATSTSAGPSAQQSSAAARGTDPATGIPEAPSAPTPSRTAWPPTDTTPAAPGPIPSATATTQVPVPEQDPPGLCVPIVGLCVRGLPILGP